MRIVILGIILGIIAVIPFGVWVSMGIFSIWLLYKLSNLDDTQIEVIQKNQYDPEILEQMK
ncbi:MAG: hypothetical protein ISR80_05325 [Nitrosopumilus sp.]|nr:hypothetical protein [Nitrosopumilus sp.]